MADADHLWETDARTDRDRLKGHNGKTSRPKPSVKTTASIRDTLLVSRPSNAHKTSPERNHRIRVAQPLDITDASLPIDPYVLGAWLGDGDTSGAILTFGEDDSEILGHIAACGIAVRRLKKQGRARLGGVRYGDVCGRGHLRSIHTGPQSHCRACERLLDKCHRRSTPPPPITVTSLQEQLREVGVLGNKHIPPRYLRGSYRQRLALLQGLMDTDGTISKCRSECEYTTTSKQLANDVVELVRSLGYKPSIHSGRAMLYGRDCGPKYRILFCAFSDVFVFRLARKRNRQIPGPINKTRSSYRVITAVAPVESVPVKCIQIDSPSRLYLAGEGMVPTHNSLLIAGVVNYILFCDGEQGGEIYSAAAEREQARLVFEMVKSQIEHEPELLKRAQLFKYSITVGSGSYKAISADAHTKHGFNTHCCVIDELHAQPDRNLVDVLKTSMGARRQPLLIHITTSDFERPSICNELHDYASKVRDGIIEDQSFLPVIYEATTEDDWTSPEVWRRVNPNLGVSVSEEFLAAECKRAQEEPAFENTFKRLYLNVRTEQAVRWLQMERWDACNEEYDESLLLGKPCWCGLDLSTTTDLSAFVMVFQGDDGTCNLVCRFWVPRENAAKRARKDRVPYVQWIKDGWLTATDGDVIDYDVIRRDIGELGKQFNIQEIAADRWNATQLITQLEGDGFNVFAFGQGYKDMSAPTKELEKLVIGGKLRTNRNPVLRWMASNVYVEQDAAGNLKPSKKKSSERIDGIVASIMAIGRATNAPVVTESIYNTPERELVFL